MSIRKTILSNYLKIKESDIMQCSPTSFIASPDWKRGSDDGYMVLTKEELSKYKFEDWQITEAARQEHNETSYFIIRCL